MKKLLLAAMAIMLFACSSDDSAPVYDQVGGICIGDRHFLSQHDLDRFASMKYSKIIGSLFIGNFSGAGNKTDITDLSGLINLVNVTERITISNTSLTSLNGLQNVKDVPVIRILYNENLVNLEGCSVVAESGSVTIANNPVLTSLHGLMLKNASGLAVGGNPNLADIETGGDFDKLGGISFEDTKAVTLEGFENLTAIGTLHLKNNHNLVSLKGFENVTKMTRLYLELNSSLQSIEHLSGLTSIAEIPGLSSDVGFAINNNDSLVSLQGLENVSVFDGSFYIAYNDELTDFCPIVNIVVYGSVINFDFNGNAYNPTTDDFIAGDCSL